MSVRTFYFASWILMLIAGIAAAQDNLLVLLAPASGGADSCASDRDPRVVTIKDYKIAGKGEVRLAGDQFAGASSVSRDQFNRMRKARIRELTEIEVDNGTIYVTAGDGQKIISIPDVEPGRGQSISMGQYASMTLEGESQSGRTKQKQVIPVNSIWRMFILTPSLTTEEALFRHAQQEASVGQWTFYLGKVTSHRMNEAGEGLAKATTTCIERAMDRFRAGKFSSITEATEMAQKLVAMTGGTGPAAERLAAIRKEEQDVRDRIRDGMQLRRENKWDDALLAWEPLSKYLKDPGLTDFAQAHAESLMKSHDAHVDAGDAALKSGESGRGLLYEPDREMPLRNALKEYDIALTRRPDSPVARNRRRDVLINLALIDARRSRNNKKPEDAHSLLVKAREDHGDDPRIAEELREANCEFGTQLFEQARAMVTIAQAAPAKPSAPKPVAAPKGPASKKGAPSKEPGIEAAPAPSTTYKVRGIQTTAEKQPFVHAREKLTKGMELCPSEDKVELLAGVNKALADYHVAQAKKATLRKLTATALLHLKAAQAYQPERSDLEGLLAEAREPVQLRSQIQTGVVITSLSRECADIARQMAGAVESALVGGGTANIQLLAHDQAQGMLQKMRSGAAGASTTNNAIVSGQIATCTVNATNQRRPVMSKLQFENSSYEPAQEAKRQAEHQYDECKRANGEQACQQVRNYRDEVRRRSDAVPRFLLRDYSYEEQTFTAAGQMRLTLQIDDSILRGTRTVGEASGTVNESCVARRGVQPNDWGQNSAAPASTAPGFRGFLQGLAQGMTAQRRIPENVECPPVEKEAKLLQMAEQVREQAQRQAAAAIHDVAKSYLELAKRASDHDLALENYITFALLTADKTGQGYQQAAAAIHSRDADLKPETALQ